MRSWSSPSVPELPQGVRGPQVRVHDSATGTAVPTRPDGAARLYVCGITPYDATHLGHAATFVGFDLLVRAWRSAGHEVQYVQNVTDVDDPLLERATATGQDWTELAERETQLFREDMEALRVLPPVEYIGAVESIPRVIEMIGELEQAGSVYRVDEDLYFSVTHDPAFGDVSGWSRDHMLATYAERGGDPDRSGKRDPLDCLLWQAEREGEPAWESPYGPGRPGWHVECAAIARTHVGTPLDVQGGGSDLIFPHHEMSAAQAQVADPDHPFARAYVHAGMVALHGEKMSKSKGNLELVSRLRTTGCAPAVIRLALLAHHYRSDWEWTDEVLETARTRWESWSRAVARRSGPDSVEVTREVLDALADDLDAPRALAAIDRWVESGDADPGHAPDAASSEAPGAVRALIDAALGVELATSPA